jgi:hypothetical protein
VNYLTELANTPSETSPETRPHRLPALLCAAVVLAVNLVIVAKLFGVEYSAYNGSVEGSFIAIARVMAKYPGQWSWWPMWSGGMPFETAYAPFSHWIVAAFSLLTGLSAPRSFHIVTAGIYALGPVTLFWMALTLSRRLAPSFVAALAYSSLSVSNLLVSDIRADSLGALNLRRLQVLVFWGEAPHTVALVLLPAAIVCFHHALTTRAVKWKILAGVVSAFVVLTNAFGAVALAGALLCWLLAFRFERWWKAPLTIAAIGVLSYCWISPWLSPAMIRAIRASAPTTGEGFRYTASSWIALAVLTGGYVLLWFALRKWKAPPHLRFFVLFGYLPAGIVAAWYAWKIAIVIQPSRYQVEMDLALLAAVVFVGAALLERLPQPARSVFSLAVVLLLALQTIHSVRYARNLIRPADPARLSEYKIAKWMDANRPGERAFIGGSASMLYNAVTDNPQFHGGHDQHMVNPFLLHADYAIYSDMNAGDRGAQNSVFWLKAFGAHAISISGPGSGDPYQPFAHPAKFDGVLPLAWRDGGDAIYDVPARSRSLAHVIPADAVPARTPVNGLDMEPVAAYVAALDDPRYPLATFQWKSLSQAEIHASADRGQVLAVQVTYVQGWEAWADGRRQRVRGDAIGQMVIEPDGSGPCEISLRYTGGKERLLTRAASLTAMIVAIGFAWRRRFARMAVRQQH